MRDEARHEARDVAYRGGECGACGCSLVDRGERVVRAGECVERRAPPRMCRDRLDGIAADARAVIALRRRSNVAASSPIASLSASAARTVERSSTSRPSTSCSERPNGLTRCSAPT
ncbi:MAG: hypothetical protein WKG01_18470 [Kofleriaceae bacterium]